MRTQIQNIARVMLAIYVICTVFVFTDSALPQDDDPCGQERRAVERRKEQVSDAEKALNEAQDSSITDSIASEAASGAAYGAIGGAVTGAIAGSKAAGVGAIPGAIGGAAYGAAGGGVVGAIKGAMAHRSSIEQAEQAVTRANSRLATAKSALRACEVRNSEYTYTCSDCGTSWGFDDYDDYMNFHHDHQ